MKFPEDCGILEAYRTWTKNLKSFEINIWNLREKELGIWTKNLKSFEIIIKATQKMIFLIWTKNLKSFEIRENEFTSIFKGKMN